MNNPIDSDFIIDTVCLYYKISRENIIKRCRDRDIVTPRQICHKLLSENTRLSLTKIGRVVGDKDHATVLHSIKVVNNLIDTDYNINNDYIKLLRLIKMTVNNEDLECFMVESYM